MSDLFQEHLLKFVLEISLLSGLQFIKLYLLISEKVSLILANLSEQPQQFFKVEFFTISNIGFTGD